MLGFVNLYVAVDVMVGLSKFPRRAMSTTAAMELTTAAVAGHMWSYPRGLADPVRVLGLS